MTPREAISDFVSHWEGGLSLNKSDTGNFVNGKLIGSKFGVTAAALAQHRDIAVGSVTADMMSRLGAPEAADIGMASYYLAPKLDMLAWNRVTVSIVDMAWGAGPAQAIKLLQRMIGAADDGKMGPATARAYADYIARHGEEAVAWEWALSRVRFYGQITASRPANLGFLAGWTNRTVYFTPKSEWWGRVA